MKFSKHGQSLLLTISILISANSHAQYTDQSNNGSEANLFWDAYLVGLTACEANKEAPGKFYYIATYHEVPGKFAKWNGGKDHYAKPKFNFDDLQSCENARNQIEGSVHVDFNGNDGPQEVPAGQLFMCMRGLVESGAGGKNFAQTTIGFFEQVFNYKRTDRNLISWANQRCKFIQDSANKNNQHASKEEVLKAYQNYKNFIGTYQSIQGDVQLHYGDGKGNLKTSGLDKINALYKGNEDQFGFYGILSEQTHTFLKWIIHPSVHCKRFGVGLLVSVVVGVNGRLEGANCVNSAGDQWFETRAGGGPAVIGPAYLTFEGGQDNRVSSEDTAPDYLYETRSGAAILGLSLPSSEAQNDYTEFGVTVGAGLGFSAGNYAHGKIFSLNRSIIGSGNRLLNLLKEPNHFYDAIKNHY